ncbi:MAG: YqiA/YcfP family alpha/beta fold hydrolase [Vicinamibacterales bacterium]
MRGHALNIVYLHGFASSAKSTKGTFFTAKLHERGVTVHTPDFNAPDFSTLTITRMIQQVDEVLEALPREPATLIGSSLGGFVALQVAMRRKIERLVLLAPAIDFSGNRLRELGDRGLDEWKRTGELKVFHYGFGRMVPLNYALYTDACTYSCREVKLGMPIQIFQGRRDTAVNPESVERWARARSNVELHMLDDNHQLTSSLETIWQLTEPFLFSGSGLPADS